MSAQAVDWALKHATTSDPVHKLVLVALANHAHRDGTAAYLSARSIAVQVGCSARSVRRYLAALEADGLIRRGDQTVAADIDPRYRPVVYDLCMSVDNRPVQVGQPVTADHPGRTDGAVQVGQNRGLGRTLLSYKPSTNQELNRRSRTDHTQLSTLPPTLDALRAAEVSACSHGARPGGCALCRRALVPF